MAIPDLQTLMLPLLRLAADCQEHTAGDSVDTLAAEFSLTEEEKNELLPSGRRFRFENRAMWALTYLKKAGLVESRGRAKFAITPRGLRVLEGKPQVITVRFLEQFPEFAEFKTLSRQGPSHEGERPEEPYRTPEEDLEAGYQKLRRELSEQLLRLVKECSPSFFESLVVDLLVAMGYGGSRKDAGEAIGRHADGGVDGMIKEDRLGLDAVYIQAKRWEGSVGRQVVQGFAGSLEGFKAKKGVLITTSQFTKDAREYVGKIEKRVVFIDGEQLVQFMIDYGIGVTQVAHYAVKRVDADYFGD